MTQPRIIIDPYFDGEAGADARVTRQREDSGPPATPPSQHGYHDAGMEMTATGGGRSALQVMRPGPEGLRGVVIPRATLGGIPQGTRPHATAGLEVTIDPHISGQSARIRLGDVTEESVARATEVARSMTPEPYNIETQRLRGAAELHAIAAAAQARGSEPIPPMHQPQQPQPHQFGQPAPAPQAQVYQPQPQYGQPYVQATHMQEAVRPLPPQPRRRVSPLQAFNQPAPQQVDPRELRHIDIRDEQPMESRGQMPQIHCFFEVQGFGELEAYYHDIVVQQGFLVLIFDSRFRGPKYFPPTAVQDNPPQLAMNISGTQEVYQLQTTGVLYEHNGYEHCVLMIERVGQLPQ